MFKTKKVFALITALTMASALGAGALADAAVIATEDANVISAADAGMAFCGAVQSGRQCRGLRHNAEQRRKPKTSL